jgi:hypothetical protein
MVTCSDTSLALNEPLAGTAPEAAAWVVLEQPGPWGRKALTESHLDPVLGEALDVAASADNARVALARRPGRHPDHHDPRAQRLWIASTRPGRSWLLGGWVENVTDLGGLSWNGIGEGDLRRVQRSMPTLRAESRPLLLVCTNGRRDVCCALKGRALANLLEDRLLGRIWETTHLSGHRFAPTAVLLPSGAAYGRLDPERALKVYANGVAGRVLLDGYRGRTAYNRPGQAAEAAVRLAIAERGVDAIDVVSVREHAGSWHAVVSHRDGRRWSVEVIERRLAPARPESCGASAVNPVSYEATPPVRVG